MAARQAPPSLGFSRQEHWSGLSFPSPMHESEKWKGSCSVVSDSVQPHRRQPTGLPIPGILQARTLEWVAISFSNAWKWKMKVQSLSCVRPLANPWTAAHQAPPSMGFSRQEYWTGVPLSSPKRTVCLSNFNFHNLAKKDRVQNQENKSSRSGYGRWKMEN